MEEETFELARKLGQSLQGMRLFSSLANWLPTIDEVIEYEGWQITVTDIRAHRIESVWLTRQPTE